LHSVRWHTLLFFLLFLFLLFLLLFLLFFRFKLTPQLFVNGFSGLNKDG
jgi:hypothetical protein